MNVFFGILVELVAAMTSPAPADVAATRPPAVNVYLLQEDGDEYGREAYDPLPRPARGARGPGERLQVALDELVRGTTRAERSAGYRSSFTRDTAGLILRAELRGRRAVVDFRDFRAEHGEWGTSYGGSLFLSQVSRTIFQFDRVESALLRIDGSCRQFWEFLQMSCEVLRRP